MSDPTVDAQAFVVNVSPTNVVRFPDAIKEKDLGDNLHNMSLHVPAADFDFPFDYDEILLPMENSPDEDNVTVNLKSHFKYPEVEDVVPNPDYRGKIERQYVDFSCNMDVFLLEQTLFLTAQEIAQIMFYRTPRETPFDFLSTRDEVLDVLRRKYMEEKKFLIIEHYKLFLKLNGETADFTCSICKNVMNTATAFSNHFGQHHSIVSLTINCPKNRKCRAYLTHPYEAHQHILKCAEFDNSSKWNWASWIMADAFRDYVGNRDDANNKVYLTQPGLPMSFANPQPPKMSSPRIVSNQLLECEELVIKSLMPECVHILDKVKVIDAVTFSDFAEKERRIKEAKEKQKADDRVKKTRGKTAQSEQGNSDTIAKCVSASEPSPGTSKNVPKQCASGPKNATVIAPIDMDAIFVDIITNASATQNIEKISKPAKSVSTQSSVSSRKQFPKKKTKQGIRRKQSEAISVVDEEMDDVDMDDSVPATQGVDEELEEDVYYVDKIVGKTMVDGEPLYCVKWKNTDESENTWEPLSNLTGCKDFVNDYEKALMGTKKL